MVFFMPTRITPPTA